MLRQLRPAIVALAIFTLLTGIVYPLVVTGVAQALFNDQANGSQIEVDGEVRGSSLIGQQFEGAEWFHSRPSAGNYDGLASGGSNLGPTNPDLLAEIEQRAEDYRTENGLSDDALVPIDAVTASGSGLDPDISPRNAELQAPRVASARGLDLEVVEKLIADNTDGRTLSVLGEPTVNVVTLNADLLALRG